MLALVEEGRQIDKNYPESVEEDFTPITLKQIWLLWYITIIGPLMAFVLLILEWFWKRLITRVRRYRAP